MNNRKPINKLLFDSILSDVPHEFLRELPIIREQVYGETYERVLNDYKYEDAEASYLLPHMRRAAFESLFRSRAKAYGLVATIESNKKNNAYYTVVRAGRFHLTASFVRNENDFVRHAHFRDKHASLNGVLAQLDWVKPDKHTVVNDLYAIVLHGADARNSNPDTFNDTGGFLQIAIPSDDNKCWVETYNIFDLLNILEQRRMDGHANMPDQAIPSRKRKRENGSN